jgi:tRNA-intron endonuclease, archaea type
MAPPRATLRGDRVLLADEKDANTLYNKGAFGVPQSGGALLLDLVEALYLVEHNRLRIEGQDAASLLRHASATERDFEVRYIVYRDLRNRTFTVKPSALTDFNIYARGALPGRAASTHLVRALSERGSLDGASLLAEVERAGKHQKVLLVALVDEEGDLTYFEASEPALSADAPALPGYEADAHLLEDRVVVSDRDARRALFEDGYFGRDIGLAHQLSLPEAVYLAEAGRLRVRSADDATLIPPGELRARANELEPDFSLRLALYRALRGRGLVVKTGFKFGTHFRVYTGAPDEEHAPYLVHALPSARRVAWPEVAGFVRLAHGVRKRLFFAVPTEAGFRLLELARRKP